MNAVIIKDLDMPSNCWECPCMRHDSYDGVNKYQCNVTLADSTDVGMLFAVAYIIASMAFIIVMTQYILGIPCPIKI